MLKSHVKTYRYRIGKKHVIVINIYQTARATAKQGNVLASINASEVGVVRIRP